MVKSEKTENIWMELLSIQFHTNHIYLLNVIIILFPSLSDFSDIFFELVRCLAIQIGEVINRINEMKLTLNSISLLFQCSNGTEISK